MPGRGMLTPYVAAEMEKFLGYAPTTAELRLIPYVQYVMVNSQKLDLAQINTTDREILSRWRGAGYIEGGASQMAITKEFWDFMCHILFIAYVAHEQMPYQPKGQEMTPTWAAND